MASGKHLIVIGGPTASGKTRWAIRLARHFGTEIVSADSRQFFREMRIGTAAPTPEELDQAPHHFIGHLSILDAYNVGDYEREALALLADLFDRHDVVVLTGGSGLYLKAVCEGLDEFPPVPSDIRQSVQDFYRQQGLAALQAEVARVDPVYFGQVDADNPARLLRALAVWRASGLPYSSFRRRTPVPRPFTPVYLQLHWKRAALYSRIDMRVDDMLAQGLVEEARRLSPFREKTALQTVGYQELFAHFDGNLNREEAVRLIKRNSRRYAKRQLTWMRRDGHWKHAGPDDWDVALDYLGLARRQGCRIVRRPAPPPASSPVTIELTAGTTSHAALTVSSERIVLLIHRLTTPTAALSDHEVKMLIHEAVCICEEADADELYAALPARFEPYLRSLHFGPAAAPPVNFRALVPVAPGESILFRKN